MKYYVRVEESEFVNGKPVKGINSILPLIKQGDELVPHPDFIEVDIEPTDNLIANQNWYKYLNSEFVKMEEAEMRLLHPSLFQEMPLSNEELLGQMITELELKLLEKENG